MIKWYISLNHVCIKLNADRIFRNSVSKDLQTEVEMHSFLTELMAKSEEWRAMKLVVLGHGRIGKTTLLREIKHSLDPQSPRVYLNYSKFYANTVLIDAKSREYCRN